jgi:hypothetical protein
MQARRGELLYIASVHVQRADAEPACIKHLCMDCSACAIMTGAHNPEAGDINSAVQVGENWNAGNKRAWFPKHGRQVLGMCSVPNTLLNTFVLQGVVPGQLIRTT